MSEEKPKKKGSRAPIVPGVMVLCPMSGNLLFGQRIKPHSLTVALCKNGSLFAVCRIHACRVFVSDKPIIHELTGEVYADEQR